MTTFRSKRTIRAVNFYCNAPTAEAVSIVGDFNHWDPKTNPMRKQPDGVWRATLELQHGHHRYAFMVDGALVLDPRAAGVTRNDAGQRVSLVPVSGF